MYEIRFSTASQKYFKKLRDKKLKNAFYEALHKIRENPYIGVQKSGDLATIYGYDVHYCVLLLNRTPNIVLAKH